MELEEELGITTSAMQHHLKVIYIPPNDQFEQLDSRTRHGRRSALVRSLIDSSGVATNCQILPLRPATLSEAQLAHSSYYLSVLHAASQACEEEEEMIGDEEGWDVDPVDWSDEREEMLEEFGLVDDCTPFRGVFTLGMLTIGGAVLAARAISAGNNVACWFDGGRHHATSDAAGGLCYVNDAIAACKTLLESERVDKVLYVDIDVHHGDGVEQSFLYTDSVITLSIHLSERGFYPNTSRDLFGKKQGAFKTDAIRVPLRRGIGDERYVQVFQKVLHVVKMHKKFDVIVLQCGCDGVGNDPLGGLNLTTSAYVSCTKALLELDKGLLILGGGGYVAVNAAKVWTEVLECCVDWMGTGGKDGKISVEKSSAVSLDDEFFDCYQPSFSRVIRRSEMQDKNEERELNEIVRGIAVGLGNAK